MECRIIAGNLFMRPQSILSLRGAADLDKREQVRICFTSAFLVGSMTVPGLCLCL